MAKGRNGIISEHVWVHHEHGATYKGFRSWNIFSMYLEKIREENQKRSDESTHMPFSGPDFSSRIMVRYFNDRKVTVAVHSISGQEKDNIIHLITDPVIVGIVREMIKRQYTDTYGYELGIKDFESFLKEYGHVSMCPYPEE